MRFPGGWLVSLGCAAFLGPVQAADDVMTRLMPQDGWYHWQIETVHPAPNWCCYSWRSSVHTPAACDLDRKSQGFVSQKGVSGAGGSASSGDLMNVFAQRKQGALVDVRVYSLSCEVHSDAVITDLGSLESEDSLALLQSGKPLENEIRDHQVAAVAVHAGPEAGNILSRMAEPGSELETRKEAVFWMAQLRVTESRDQLLRFIEQDPSAELREHAAFSYAQSDATDRVEVLIGIIEDRERELSDRSNALFWLVESGSEQGVDYIQKLLTAN